MRSTCCVAACVAGSLLIGLSVVPGAAAREWTNNRGKRLEATFVRLRGEVAFLRAKGELVRAPVEQLSFEDQAWVERYRELTAPRDWGETAIHGEIQRVTAKGVDVKAGSKRGTIPFAKLMVDDFEAAQAFCEHLEREIPESFDTERHAAVERAPPEGLVVREWSDTRGRRMRAGFEGTAGRGVILWRGSKRFELPLDKLSAADRTWVSRQSLGQLAEDVRGGVSATRSLVTLAFVKAMASGRPMPRFDRPVVEPKPESEEVAAATQQPAPAPEEAAMAPGAYASAHPSRGPPPWINDIDDLSPNQAEARLREAFGGWIDSEEELGGIGYCSHCAGEFAYPVGFSQGKPACPFCGSALASDALEDWDELADESDSGWRTPWYLRRSGRRLIVCVVVTLLGAGVKFMMSGGD